MRRARIYGLLTSGLVLAFACVGTATTANASPDPAPPCTTNATALTPVICLPDGFGEDQAAPLGTGDTIPFDGQVVNNGPAVAHASVAITLPAGLRVDPTTGVTRFDDWWDQNSDNQDTTLTCTSTPDGSALTCDTGALAQGANLLVEVDLVAQPTAVVGTSGTFTVALQAAPSQPTFPATQVQATIDYTGIAHLQVSLTPPTATVTVGKSTTLTATIVNVGPNPAPDTVAFGFSSPTDNAGNSHFTITNSSTSLPIIVSPPGSATASSPASLTSSQAIESANSAKAAKAMSIRIETTSPGAASGSPFGLWPVGTITAGTSASVSVVVQAVSAGTDELDVSAGSDAGDPPCDTGAATGCENEAAATLTAVAAPVVVSPTPTVTVTVTASPIAGQAAAGEAADGATTLANTGTDTQPLLLVGILALLLGGACAYFGRKRELGVASHRHHH